MRNNKKRANIGSKVLVIILIMSIIIPLFPTMKVEAKGEGTDYRDLVKLYQKEYNVKFKTPTPKFDLKIQNGKTHFIAPTEDEDKFPYETHRAMPIIDTIKTGTKFQVFEKAETGSGKKIVKWDWQVYYRDKEGKEYNRVFGSSKNLTNLPAPTKEGHISIYLNVADDYKLAKNKAHINYNAHGNWRTEYLLDRDWGMPGVKVKGWYFTGAKIEVRDTGASDMIMRELELIDPETGKVLESFKREVDPLDPFNTKKEKLIRTSTRPQDSSLLKKDVKYMVRAKYQFVSFEEGKFDISKRETMTEKQRNLSTEVIPNELDVHYSYDDNVFKDGVFDNSINISSKDKANIELKNLEYATFEWEGKTGLGNKE